MKMTECSAYVLFKISCVTDESVSEEFVTHPCKKNSWTSPPMWPEDHTPTDLSPRKLSHLRLHPREPCCWLTAEMEGMIKLKISSITRTAGTGTAITGSFNLRNSVYLGDSINHRWLDIWFQVYPFQAYYKWNGEGKKLNKATLPVISIQCWIKWFTSTNTFCGGRGKNGGGQKVDLKVQCSRSHTLQ